MVPPRKHGHDSLPHGRFVDGTQSGNFSHRIRLESLESIFRDCENPRVDRIVAGNDGAVVKVVPLMVPLVSPPEFSCVR